jgi:hypothetical protein
MFAAAAAAAFDCLLADVFDASRLVATVRGFGAVTFDGFAGLAF